MAGDLEVTAPEYLVADLVECEALALIYGEPGTGKSFAALALAASVSSGQPWLGHKTKPGPVIYVAGEGNTGIARRLKAWGEYHGTDLDDLHLAVTTGPIALGDPAQGLHLANLIDEITLTIGKPALIVIDTVARNFGPGDENSTADMARFIGACDELKVRYGATVLLVHHPGHGNKDRARGAMALKGALDAEYRLEAREEGVVEMIPQKMKEAPLPRPLAFRLEEVTLGDLKDSQGHPVTSVVPVETDAPPAGTKRPALGNRQREALDVLVELYAQRRENLEVGGHNPNQARVTLSEWREQCKCAGMPRQRAYDATQSLTDSGAVTLDPPYVHLVE